MTSHDAPTADRFISHSLRRRLAVVVSHPIQYFAHLYRDLAAHPQIDLKVFFGSTIGATAYHDPGLGVELAWQCDLLGGYAHEFLPGADQVRQLDRQSLAKVPVAPALDSWNPDALLVHGYATPLVRSAWQWAIRHRKPVLLFGDGNGRIERSQAWYRRWAKRLMLTHYLSMIHRVLTLGEANELYWRLLGVPDSKMQWAPFYNPAPETILPQGAVRTETRHRVRQELGVAEHQIVVLSAGKFLPRKRTIDLVQAVERCRDVLGVYVGDGQCRSACEAEARSDRHRFVGFANLPRMAELFSAADIFCHPAQAEPYGLVVAEAAAAGLPILATESTGAIGARSHGRIGENAIVFPEGDVEALVRSIQQLASDSAKRQSMAQRSLAIASQMKQSAIDGVIAALASK
ncbi:MAG: glycosyltransferase family 4 protein [Pirellulaceae bacterium]